MRDSYANHNLKNTRCGTGYHLHENFTRPIEIPIFTLSLSIGSVLSNIYSLQIHGSDSVIIETVNNLVNTGKSVVLGTLHNNHNSNGQENTANKQGILHDRHNTTQLKTIIR